MAAASGEVVSWDVSRRHPPSSEEVKAIAQFQQELVGTELQNIRILRKIGDGGFAQVFSAQLPDGTTVAVKKWTKLELTPDLNALFLREIECIRRCDHPNVVKFLGAYTRPVSVVMELVEGRSLFELIHGRMHYDWSLVRRVGYDAALAIEHVHSRGILHRDLKSSNFLLSKDLHVKLCDFGLGRMISTEQRMTGGRGTPFWMAPEVIAHQQYAEPADVYSYGIVMWEMCARATPYDDNPDNNDIMKIVLHVLQHGLRPTMPRNMPPAVEALIRSCWDAKPERRPTWKQIEEFWQNPACIPPAMLHQRVEP